MCARANQPYTQGKTKKKKTNNLEGRSQSGLVATPPAIPMRFRHRGPDVIFPQQEESQPPLQVSSCLEWVHGMEWHGMFPFECMLGLIHWGDWGNNPADDQNTTEITAK